MCTLDTDRPRFVLVHRYFDPDTPPYAVILKEIAQVLAEHGAVVDVLTCQPSYNAAPIKRAAHRESITPGVRVTRWTVVNDRTSSAAKILNLVVFCVRLIIALIGIKRIDVVMAASTPPIAVAMVVSLIARAKRAKFVYHKQDIYPEIVDAVAPIPSALRRILRAVDSGTDRRAERVVVLSKDMAKTVADRGVPADRIAILNNFDPWPVGDDMTSARGRRQAAAIRLVYAGNLGHFQNFQMIFETLQQFERNGQVAFDFIGEGPMKARLQTLVAEHNLNHVHIHGYVEPRKLGNMLRHDYDVGLVSLYPGVIRAAYPSKTMTYLRNGLPVLALVEPGTEIVAMLEKYGAGWQADPGMSGSLPRVVERIIAERSQLNRMSESARIMYKTEFGKGDQLERWTALFSDVYGVRA